MSPVGSGTLRDWVTRKTMPVTAKPASALMTPTMRAETSVELERRIAPDGVPRPGDDEGQDDRDGRHDEVADDGGHRAMLQTRRTPDLRPGVPTLLRRDAYGARRCQLGGLVASHGAGVISAGHRIPQHLGERSAASCQSGYQGSWRRPAPMPTPSITPRSGRPGTASRRRVRSPSTGIATIGRRP